MPRADEYAGAAAALDNEARAAQRAIESIGNGDRGWAMPLDFYEGQFARTTLAARCVRAMAALASGAVLPPELTPMSKRIGRDDGRDWSTARGIGQKRHYAADPLDAITAALGGDDAPR